MRLPVHAVDELRLVGKARRAFRQAHGHEPGFDELLSAIHGLGGKTALRIKPKRLKVLLKSEPGLSVSLDAPVGRDEGGQTLLESLGEADRASDVAVFDALDELRLNANRLRIAVDSLNDRWRRIVALRYGWFGDPAMSLRLIGQRCGLSRERIRQIATEALVIIGRTLQKKPREIHELLTVIGEIWNEPLLADRPNASAPEPGAFSCAGGDGPVLEDHFAILSEHAKDWRERGDFIVFAPVPTLLARERFSTLHGAKQCVEALVAKGWAEWVGGTDAVKLRRHDKLPMPKGTGRSNKTLLWLTRHALAGKRVPVRTPTPAEALRFLDERAIACGNKRVARPATTLLCVQFRLDPQAAVRILDGLREHGAIASSDDYKSVIMLKKRLPTASRSRRSERVRRDSEVRQLDSGAARMRRVASASREP
jgi:hypothetical protein